MAGIPVWQAAIDGTESRIRTVHARQMSGPGWQVVVVSTGRHRGVGGWGLFGQFELCA